MSTPGTNTDPADDDSQAAPTAPPRRRGSRRKTPAASPQQEHEAGTAEVVYLGDSEADRLARIQGRIRTKKGRYLRSLSDLGNAERYMDTYAGDLLYVDESGKWRGFNGKHWADTIKDRELHKRVVKVLREIWQEAQQCRPEDAAEVRKWAKKSEEKATISAAKSLLLSECAVSIQDFDRRGAEADTLNLANGTLNLETFELRPHAKEDMLSKFSPVVYDPAATCPNWLRHLEWAIPDPDTRETIQRYFGYALTSETREQKMLCFYGSKGRNGKGVIVRVMERVLGYDDKNPGTSEYSYAQSAPASLLLDGKRGPNDASPDMARLVGKRFVALQETEPGQKFSESRLNGLTGGDTISARLLHQNYFEFTPVAKYVLCTNNRPEVANDNPATWRRLFLVNFPNTISDEARDADPDYETRIQDELSGILNWLLEGLRKWRTEGTLKISDAIRADTAAYRAEQDWFGQFMADCLEEREAHLVSAAAAYAVYQKWAQDAGQGVLAQRRFRSLLGTKIETLYTKKAGNPSEWYYGGLAFRDGVLQGFEHARYPGNAAQRPDPGSPPPEHTAHYAVQRRAAAAREAAAAAAAAAQPEPAPAPPAPAAPEPAPGRPTLVSLDSLSALCRADQHARCADALATGEADECWCPCHEPGDDTMPLDFDPTPDPADAIDPADRAAILAEFGESEHDIDAVIDTPATAPAPEIRYSERAFTPWTVKMSAYADLAAGEGITDDGRTFEIRKRGKLASLAELLRALPEDVRYVHLTGADIGTGSELMTWANTRPPKGWTATDRAHSSDETRDRVSLRYRRPAVDGRPGAQVVVYRAANWIDRDHETTTSPAELRDAFALVLDGLRATFGDVVGEDYGVPLKGTPAATGLELIRRTLPRDRSRTPHRYPVLPTEIQHMIRSHAGQARTEDFASAETHPTAGAHIPDRIPGLYVYDMRFAYAALLDLELPAGPVVRDEVPEFAKRGSGWEPCLYRVRVTVPEGWDRAGRFRTRDDAGVWIYPAEPGTVFESWTWERGLYAADRDGWKLGEHVEILERYRFTGPKTKPLATFGRALRELRDGWIPAQTDAPESVRELGRIMARQIAIAAIGKLSGTPYGKLHSCPIEDLDARPTDGRSVWKSNDGKRWEWRENITGRETLIHPEWSAYIWATCREWLYDHPAQKGVGLRHVPRAELIAARTDGFWTSTPQPVEDTGKVGHFRCQLAHDGELTTPRTYTELNAVRSALLAEEGTR